MKRLSSAIIVIFLSLYGVASMAESCNADVELVSATQDDDGWVTAKFTIDVSNCNRSQGTFDYIIYWVDDDGESGKPIKRVGNWGVQDTSQTIPVTERDQLADGQALQVVEAGRVLTCVCHD